MSISINVSQVISWDYNACILRTFRVTGTCCGANAPYVVNITACTVDEVCRKLLSAGLVSTIENIQVFNTPVEGPHTENPGSLTDVTPTIPNCQSCCVLMIDEDHFQEITVADSLLGRFSYPARGSVMVSGSAGGSQYPLIVGGTIRPVGKFRYLSCNYNYTMNGNVNVDGECVASPKYHYHYTMNDSVIIVGYTQLGFGVQARGIVNVYAVQKINYQYPEFSCGFSGGFVAANCSEIADSMSSRLNITYSARGAVRMRSSFDIESCNHYCVASGNVNVNSYTRYRSNDLGTVCFVAKVVEEADEVGVVFDVTPAPVVVPLVQSVSMPLCCSLPIPTFLLLGHNLGGLLSLSRFLLYNNLNLPNELPLQYSPKLGTWQTNVHYSGQSADTIGSETWNILFEFYCSNHTGATYLPTDVWQFVMFIRKLDTNGLNLVVRLSVLFGGSVFCSNFNGFSFEINVQNLVTVPASLQQVIFYDEAGLSFHHPLLLLIQSFLSI